MIIKNIRSKGTIVDVVVVLVSSIIASIVVWAANPNNRSVSFDGTNQTNTEYVEKLKEFRRGYTASKSVHIVADAQITLYGDSFRVGKGSYEYWAEGNRYRIRCHTDKHLGFLPDVDVAYDGRKFYHLDRASGILSYQQHDISTTIGALPNPLFLPVSFLSIEDDACPFCGLRWTDFKSQNIQWNHRFAGLEIRSQTKEKSTGRVITDLEMPGGVKGKRQFKIHLRVAGTADGKTRPIQFDQIGQDGRSLTSMTFSDFISTALGEFPRTTKLEVFDEKSTILVKMIYSLKTLELDQPLEKDAFAISFDEAGRVWDSDSKKFVKGAPQSPRP